MGKDEVRTKFGRDHAVRIAVSHLKGAERAAEIVRLLEHPKEVGNSLRKKFQKLPRGRRPIAIAVRLSAEEFLLLRDTAKNEGRSISQYVRDCIRKGKR